MKIVLLAGGFGTRISEESHLVPKPMIKIGEKPLLWHILKIYLHYGFNEFVVCLGYKGECITDYFANYALRNSNVTFDFTKYAQSGKVDVDLHSQETEPWKITLVNTGHNTMTGGRVYHAKPFLENSTFMLTYGDGVGNINIKELLDFHRSHGKLATVTAVQPLARFGSLELTTTGRVVRFMEKPSGGAGIINAGFFVLEPGVLDYIDGDVNHCVFEEGPLERLAADGQLYAFQHKGFWKPMDTLRDKRQLEEEWAKPNCAWRIWA